MQRSPAERIVRFRQAPATHLLERLQIVGANHSQILPSLSATPGGNIPSQCRSSQARHAYAKV
jgi:hypothetical protein